MSSDIIGNNFQAIQINDRRNISETCTHGCNTRRGSIQNEPSCSWSNVTSIEGGRQSHSHRVQYENILKCSEMHDLSWNHANLLAYQRNIASNQAMASSNSVSALSAHTPRTDSRKSYMSDIGNMSHCKFEGNLYKRNEPYGSSWSLSNINVRNVPVQNEASYPHYENVRRKSEDNIRKYNAPLNVQLNPICTQPRESSHIQLEDVKDNGQAINNVVHWTNSVENRVCCPETVLYGAVYGLKCLK